MFPGSGYYKKNAAMNTVEKMSLWYECASFPVYDQMVIAGSWGKLILSFQDRVSLYSLDCPGTHHVDQVDLKLTEICLFLFSFILKNEQLLFHKLSFLHVIRNYLQIIY